MKCFNFCLDILLISFIYKISSAFLESMLSSDLEYDVAGLKLADSRLNYNK